MKKEEAFSLWADFINGELTEEEQIRLQKFLHDNPDVKAEFESLGKLWNQLDSIAVPEPSKRMDENFQAMLAGHQVKQFTTPSWRIHLVQLFNQLIHSRITVAATALLIGLGFGYYLQSGSQTNQQLAALNTEVSQMKKMMMFTLLEQPKATDRLKAVQLSGELTEADDRVVEALLSTLNNDPNVNVRLMAAQSLVSYSDNAAVRSGLVTSITNQRSPVIQSALADIMLQLMERSAASQFEKLMNEQEVDTLVAKKIKRTIEILI